MSITTLESTDPKEVNRDKDKDAKIEQDEDSIESWLMRIKHEQDNLLTHIVNELQDATIKASFKKSLADFKQENIDFANTMLQNNVQHKLKALILLIAQMKKLQRTHKLAEDNPIITSANTLISTCMNFIYYGPLKIGVEENIEEDQVDFTALNKFYKEILLLRQQKAEQPEAQQNFVKSVVNLHRELSFEIATLRSKQEYCRSLSNKFTSQHAIKVADATTDLLTGLHTTPSGGWDGIDKVHYRSLFIKDYQKNCNQISGISLFLKAITLVTITAVGFLMGAAIGASIGVLAGSWSGYGAAATGLVGLVKGGISGASIGLALGTLATGVTFGMVGRHLLFQAPRFKRDVLKVHNAAANKYIPTIEAPVTTLSPAS